MHSGIYNHVSKRFVIAADVLIGIWPESVRSAVLAFPSCPAADEAATAIASQMGLERKHLQAKKLRQGMSEARLRKDRIEKLLSARIYCGFCGCRIRQRKAMQLEGTPITGEALVRGEFVTVQLCSVQCQRQLSAANERKLECLDKEMVALRNGEAVLKSMKAHLKEKAREACQSRKRASELAISSLNSCQP